MKQQSVVKLVFVFAASCALAAGFTVPTLRAQAAAKGRSVPMFEADPSWPPKLPNNWNWGVPTWVAVDRHDNVWVLHRPRMGPADLRTNPAPAVVEFDKNGKFVNAWGAPGAGYDWPDTEHGIFVDHKDRVWITGINPNAGREVSTRVDDMILKFTNKGQFLQQIGGRDLSGGNKDTKNPHQSAEVFILPNSNEAFVADGYGNRRVWVIDTETLAFKRMWGAFGKEPNDPPPPAPAPVAGAARGTPPPLDTEGPGPNTWGIVHGLKVSNDKMVYVADRANRRLQVFTTEGKYLTQGFVNRGTSRLSCATVLFSPDKEQKYIYCPDFARGEIVVVDRKSLETLTHYGGLGSAPGQMQNVHGAAIDSKGNIYTSEVMPGRRVQKWVYKGMTPAPTQ